MSVVDYLQSFAEPDPRFTPVPAWWWSGEPLRWPKMKWQMEQMRAMGLRNFVVIGLAPSGAMFGSDADEPAFMSEPWWDLFGKVCDHAKTLGMFVWFYDQIGFSGANFQTDLVAANPHWSGQRLKSVAAEGEGELLVRCPDVGTPIAAYFASDNVVEPVPIVDRVARVMTNRPGTLRLAYSIRQAYDYFDPEACQALLDTVHREYARRLGDHVGTTLVGSFQDELPELPTWGSTFADSFSAAFGYRIENVIHRLFEPGDVDAARTRVHFHQHRANLAEAAFFKPFFDWYESHNMQCGYDQQSPAREARVLGCIEKYADYLQTQKWYALPGSDLHGNGKLHSSIAFLNNRPRVWLEGFHTTGWGGTIADTFDWLLPYLQSGVTLYNPHAIYYGTGRGWWEWAPPSTGWRQPYAMHYAGFADMIARLTKLLSQGVHQATVGVLFPTATAQSAIGAEKHFAAAATADATLHDVLGSMRWHQVKTGALDACAIAHHVLDEPAIAAADVRDGRLWLNGVGLRGVVLPGVTMLLDATLEKLQAFAAAGGTVVVVNADTATTLTRQAVRWDSVAGVRVVNTANEAAGILADLPADVRSDLPILHRRDGKTNIAFIPAADGMATVVKWDSWFAPMEHTTIVPERYRARTTLRLNEPVAQAWRFDAATGTSEPLSTTVDGTGTQIDIDFAGSPYVVLVWTSGDTHVDVPAVRQPVESTTLPNEWQCEYAPTLPTEHADIYDPQRPEQRWPTTPAFRWHRSIDGTDFSGGLPADAEIVAAGFGERAAATYDDGRRTAVVFSPEFGIDHDKLHQLTLGPKAHVPEEFVDLGKLPAGASATVEFAVECPRSRDVAIVLGANAGKQLTLNGQRVALHQTGYAQHAVIHLRAGVNAFALKLTAQSNTSVRAFWSFLDSADIALATRPERLVPPTPAAFGAKLPYFGRFGLPAAATGGVMRVSTAAMCEVFLDNRSLGRQGGFDPYRLQMRGQNYAVESLAAGEHEVRLEIVAPASAAPVLVDAEFQTADGVVQFVTDGDWTVSIDNGPSTPTAIHLKQDADGAAWHLRRRPHPLPRSAWLDNAASVGLDLPLAPPLSSPATHWLAWTVPPGAGSMAVPLVDASGAALWIDGKAVAANDFEQIALAGGTAPARQAVLRVDSRQSGGGLLRGPVTYAFGIGTLRTGDAAQQGLASYSGAMRLYGTITIQKANDAATLDLGRVRGTVEAFVNGHSVGTRWMSPYRFEIRPYTQAGENAIELVLTNTLVNHLSTWSPTRWWSPDQLVFGLLERGTVTTFMST